MRTGGGVLVTGGTGFTGTAALRALLATGADVRVLTRAPLPAWALAAGATEVRGDLLDPRSLRGACEGTATLLHLAAQVGGEPATCEAVNVDGTRALLAEAHRSGVTRVLHLSTAAVYGRGTRRGARVRDLVPNPVSDTSRTRLRAEELVRAAGGTVLRPNLIYGQGDRWFLPAVFRVLATVPAWVDGGSAQVSVVAVDDLARVITALALSPWRHRPGTAFHVNHPRRTSYRDLVLAACAAFGLPAPSGDIAAADCRALLPQLTDHQFELLTQDNWYASARIWRHTHVNPGPHPLHGLAAAAAWYRAQAIEAGLTPIAEPQSNGDALTRRRN
ncbi:NAD-dependent epimerase/dehydratase family protein [Actinokineospora bangkokensis]|uniref:NAD-dependent epimerase/dehydratase domain-containing protein n=1 Tax=Actinokineospora bangkokensis TaxID=1193682 RepID=A0A1Q9LBY7_9PSEU|nr:NAD-dependent epimerase/dehydratase family protein [Actinokineospora bangkokensis]OLR89530.1 hypothetical protein BJP25_05475 [Actinokineospora bangkokensis]